MPDNVTCDGCLADGTTETFFDWSWVDAEGDRHESWLCPACDYKAQSEDYNNAF